MSGYQIKEVIGHSIGHFWSEGYGQIYPTLKQLAIEGLVTSEVEPGNGKPDRRVHMLTDAGWAELQRWLTQPPDSQRPGRSELLLKLFFGRHSPAGTNLAHVRQQRELLAGVIAQYEAIEAHLIAESSPDQPYWLITLRHGLHVTRASLAWADETIARLTELEGTPQ